MDNRSEDIWPKYIRSNGLYTIFAGHKCPLSNLYVDYFHYGHSVYSSVEQLYAYSKACYFGDMPKAQLILQTTNPYKIKRISKQIKNFDAKCWEGIRNDIMYSALQAKFSQSQTARDVLLNTKGTILMVGSTNLYWDTGRRLNDALIWQKDEIKGSNVLGRMLTDIRRQYY